jgi:hypothetical protein
MFQTLTFPILQALPGDVAIQVRDTQSSLGTQQSSTSSTPSYVLLAGHHFMVIAEGKIVLDHIFGGAQQKASGGSDPSSQANAAGARSGVVPSSTGAVGQPSGVVHERAPAAANSSSGAVVSGPLPGAGNISTAVTPGKLPVNRDATAPTDKSVTKQDSGATMGAHAKTLGPLTIHNVSPLLQTCPAEFMAKCE